MSQTQFDTTATTIATGRFALPLSQGKLGRWELVGLVAEGPITRVYQARPAGAKSESSAAYAVKVLRPEWETDPPSIGLLHREALVGRSVTHPHLIPILGSGATCPPYYVVMPWLDGMTLAARLSTGVSIDLPAAFWIVRQAAEALQALHAAGWVHGDVKPSNLFVSPEGHLTLLDLGFARRTGRNERGRELPLAGTWSYLAPERAAALHPVDGRSDVYSLGVLLFEILSGKLPFTAVEPADLVRQHREVRPPDLRELVSALPTDAGRLVGQMLAKEPLRRPPAGDVIERLAKLEIATFARRDLRYSPSTSLLWPSGVSRT